jgi:UDP-glucose 4-epimerase
MSESSVVVTGGAGFIGSHLVESLVDEGLSPVVIDDLSSGDPARLSSELRFEQLDITDAQALDRVIGSAKPSAIFHLAAQSSVTVSVQDPGRDCQVNVRGTLNVLESSRRLGTPVVFASTGGALYGNSAPRPTPESSIPAPWRRMAHPNGLQRRTSTRGRNQRVSPMPFAGSATSSVHDKAPMARPA